MNIKTSNNIRISVESNYDSIQSNPSMNKYIFGYRVSIRNEGSVPVQLMRRHWSIVDATSRTKKVAGEGVIGQQPVIYPQDTYSYNSWSQIPTPIGKMGGYYEMRVPQTKDAFIAVIPDFVLEAPFKNN